jgi:hypothetical protein
VNIKVVQQGLEESDEIYSKYSTDACRVFNCIEFETKHSGLWNVN